MELMLLMQVAQRRLAENIRLGRSGHFGNFAPARAEGCGNVTDTNHWYTCWMETRQHRRAGTAQGRLANGRVFQVLVLR